MLVVTFQLQEYEMVRVGGQIGLLTAMAGGIQQTLAIRKNSD